MGRGCDAATSNRSVRSRYSRYSAYEIVTGPQGRLEFGVELAFHVATANKVANRAGEAADYDA
jgi:hypothetical protein